MVYCRQGFGRSDTNDLYSVEAARSFAVRLDACASNPNLGWRRRSHDPRRLVTFRDFEFLVPDGVRPAYDLKLG